ncbi:MAG: ribosome silencing factor [Spirochaetota bacterium]
MSNEIEGNIKNIVIRVAELLKDEKARDIVVLDLNGLTSITDYFIICTANSAIQTRALARTINEYASQLDLKPFTRNVNFDSPWVLIDYNYFIVHIFLEEGRNYYQLEKFWVDAQAVYTNQGGLV